MSPKGTCAKTHADAKKITMKDFIGLLPLIIPLCIASAAIAITLTKGKIFQSQRNWLRMNFPWFGKLLSCAYCTSHWIVFIAMIFYHPIVVRSNYYLVDIIVSAFCLVGITAICIGLVTVLIKFEPDLTTEELNLVKKMANALKDAKELIEKQKSEIATLKET